MSQEHTGTVGRGRPRHARLRRQNPGRMIGAIIASVLAIVLVSVGLVGAVTVNTFSNKLQAASVAISETDAPPPNIGALEGGFNILIVGSDTREGYNNIDGSDEGGVLNDVNILLHVAEDQQSAVAISFPRDLEVPLPECAQYFGYSNKINTALQGGNFYDGNGLGCVVQTVENFVGVPIQFAAMITFAGVINMAGIIGGVDVCVTGPVVDENTGLNLPAAGIYSLTGTEALAFLRTRGGVGDGSDWGRVSSQQVYLSSLIRKVKSEGVLDNPSQVAGIALAALNSMQMSQSLADPATLVAIAQVFKDLPLNRVTFVQYPSYSGANGNAQPNTTAGDQLFEYIRADQPFVLEAVGDDRGSTVDTSQSLTEEEQSELADNSGLPTLEGVSGQTAADFSCSVANN